MADSLEYCATKLEEATGGDPSKLHGELQKLLTEIMNEHGSIIFNGDGYSDEWHEEAAKRGLLNLKTTVDALPVLETQEVKDLFTKYEVLSERELASRLEIYLEQYIMSIKVELNLTVKIAKTMIFPAAIRYQGELVSNCASLKMLDYDFDTNTLDKVTELVKSLQDGISELEAAAAGSESEDMLSEATHCCTHDSAFDEQGACDSR